MNLQPTYTGYVANTHDALLLFQATITGRLTPVSRRPHDRERTELVQSGAVFVFNEQTSGIKRWTDGIAWSPSRILGNFLVYRQLEKPFTPGEKKQTNKRSSRRKQRHGSSPYHHTNGSPGTDEEIKYASTNPNASMAMDMPSYDNEAAAPAERSLVGSLVDSYGFKKDGLIKKTMSITVGGQPHHLVSYYRPEDVLSGAFESPSNAEFFKDLTISEELTQRQNFRVPLDTPTPSASAPPQQQQQSQQQQQQSQAPFLQQQQQGYQELPYDVEIQNFEQPSSTARIKTSPTSPPFYRAQAQQAQHPTNGAYVSGYRSYGAATHQPYNATAAPASSHDYYQTPNTLPPPQAPYQYTRTPGSGGATVAAATGAAGYAASLPPLAQQGYNYQAYGHEHFDAAAAGAGGQPAQSPRRMPELQQQQQTAAAAPVVQEQAQQAGQAYGYGGAGYGYNGQW